MNLKGYHLHFESFFGTTDSNGDLTCTTAQKPLQNGIMAYTSNGAYITKVNSISGTTTKVRFYKIQYDKAISTVKEVDNLPTNVTQATSKTTTEGGGAVYQATNGAPAANLTDHSHGLSFQYLHTHDIPNFTTTDAVMTALGVTANVNASLIYASND